MKKKSILYILLIIILTMIIGLTFTYIKNRNDSNASNIDENDNKSLIDNENIDENKSLSKWYYKETLTKNMPDTGDNYKLSLKYIDFKELSIEVCYDLCYSIPYTIDDNILSIKEGEYFSGKFKMTQENDKMYLEQDFSDNTAFIYVFQSKEDN